jgi:hypothetical protein
MQLVSDLHIQLFQSCMDFDRIFGKVYGEISGKVPSGLQEA